ncbi:hypothetical protein ACJVC5_09750 [Peredibacter sp. HCB2-198]|uniref:hypothetical protein n=1 Tax=Peredibacter sp. HCB2-198 TaxID=3383025 RepID=UPI0038B4B824
MRANKVEFLIFVIFLIISSVGHAETNEWAKYDWVTVNTKGRDPLNGGPLLKYIQQEPRKIYVYSPAINLETIEISPRPTKVVTAIQQPEIYFKKEIEIAIQQFDNLSKDFLNCSNSKPWPEKTECLKKIEICFEKSSNIQLMPCFDIGMLQMCKQKMPNCLHEKEAFQNFLRCFSPNIDLGFMYEIYNKEAKIRPYYTLDVGPFEPSPDIHCRFTYYKNKFHLIEILFKTFERPELNVIPKKTHVEDNIYELKKKQNKSQGKSFQ